QTVLVSAATSLPARPETVRPEITLDGPYVIESFEDYEQEGAFYDEPHRDNPTAGTGCAESAYVAQRGHLRDSIAARIIVGLIALAGTAYAIMHVILGVL
ncbi:hypothetical protein, partial [Methanothrix sp.]|uniref:hypothetical protein n=1 Tax=Methanothrix sp. TaxID=90426 RepID=UPI003D1042DB